MADKQPINWMEDGLVDFLRHMRHFFYRPKRKFPSFKSFFDCLGNQRRHPSNKSWKFVSCFVDQCILENKLKRGYGNKSPPKFVKKIDFPEF